MKRYCTTLKLQNRLRFPCVNAEKWCYHNGSMTHSIQRITHFSSSNDPSYQRDPTARRPNKVCDPYGLNGQPMSFKEAATQLTLLNPGWHIETNDKCKDGPPLSLQKEFCHLNYIDGSKFMHKVAAVAQNNNHYPLISLERRLMKKEKAWKVITTVKCSTKVLGGLSFHDFHIAMLVDVELAREDAKGLVVKEDFTDK